MSESAAARPRRVMLLGGTSEIGLAIVRALAEKGPVQVALVGREQAALQRARSALGSAGVTQASVLSGLEARATERHAEIIGRAWESLRGAEIAILAVGVLGQRGGFPDDIEAAVQVLDVNVSGAGSLLIHTAERMRQQGAGTIIVLSSAAAVRARRSNPVYCASKAAIDALAQGLADALHVDGVEILVVRPGFVTTRMTQGLPRPPLACDADQVGKATVAAFERGAQTVWVPQAIGPVMAILRLLPRRIFRRLEL